MQEHLAGPALLLETISSCSSITTPRPVVRAACAARGRARSHAARSNCIAVVVSGDVQSFQQTTQREGFLFTRGKSASAFSSCCIASPAMTCCDGSGSRASATRSSGSSRRLRRRAVCPGKKLKMRERTFLRRSAVADPVEGESRRSGIHFPLGRRPEALCEPRASHPARCRARRRDPDAAMVIRKTRLRPRRRRGIGSA